MHILKARSRETQEGSARLPADRNVILEESRQIPVGDMGCSAEEGYTTLVKMLAEILAKDKGEQNRGPCCSSFGLLSV